MGFDPISPCAVTSIATKCKGILTLKMVGLYKISEASMFHFVGMHVAPKLQVTDIRNPSRQWAAGAGCVVCTLQDCACVLPVISIST